MGAFLQNVVKIWAELAPWLLLGAAVAGVLHVLLPAGFVARFLRGKLGVVRAVLVGVPMPLCSCGVIPAGIGLKRQGASDGASLGFLIATPQTGVDSIFVAGSMLGWPFALFKVVSALGLGVLGGWLTDSSDTEEILEVETSKDRSFAAGLAHAVEMIQSVAFWLTAGVLVSALITTLTPATGFESLRSVHPALIGGATLIIAVPLYVCSTASVPVAAALVAAGFPVGAALVFLMAGPATNLATIGAIRGAFGTKKTAIYLSVVVGGSLVLGYLFDFLLEPSAVHTHAHVHGIGWFAGLASVVVAGLVAHALFDDVRRRFRRDAAPSDTPQLVELEVGGITCGGCVRKLEGALNKIENVDFCEVQKPSAPDELGHVKVRGIDRASVVEAITAAGFSPRA